MAEAVQVWNPDDWEAFARFLLESLHGPLNVHQIPAAHRGDLGIDYYCTAEVAAYQCYAVTEPIDIGIRATRQKKKITKDVGKLISRAAEVSKLFLGAPVRHWVLLVPLHDSKDVNLHCSTKTVETRAKALSHIDPKFEVSVRDLKSFAPQVVAAGMATQNSLVLSVPDLTPDELKTWQVGSPDLLANATSKLLKRSGPETVQGAVAEAVRSFLESNAILDALRDGAPDLHERIISAVTGRARRLNLAGPQGGSAPSAILGTEIDSLVIAIKEAAPNLSAANAEQIALGSVAEWLMRCPLDFP